MIATVYDMLDDGRRKVLVDFRRYSLLTHLFPLNFLALIFISHFFSSKGDGIAFKRLYQVCWGKI
jgi:hypothetical protein